MVRDCSSLSQCGSSDVPLSVSSERSASTSTIRSRSHDTSPDLPIGMGVLQCQSRLHRERRAGIRALLWRANCIRGASLSNLSAQTRSVEVECSSSGRRPNLEPIGGRVDRPWTCGPRVHLADAELPIRAIAEIREPSRTRAQERGPTRTGRTAPIGASASVRAEPRSQMLRNQERSSLFCRGRTRAAGWRRAAVIQRVGTWPPAAVASLRIVNLSHCEPRSHRGPASTAHAVDGGQRGGRGDH